MNIKSNQIPISYNKLNFKGNLASTPTKFKADKYLQEGLYDNAISEYQKALTFDFQNSEIKLNIGKSYAFSNQFTQAIGYLENYVKESHPSCEIYFIDGKQEIYPYIFVAE